MKTIKRKTYNNFMYILKLIMAKGYNKTEAEEITHRIFEQYNPNGLSIIEIANRTMTKQEYITEYGGIL